MQRTKHRRVWMTVTILAVLGLVVTACGSDEPAETTQAPTTTAAPTTTEAEMMAPTELDVAMIVVGAKEQGWYATVIDAIGRLGEDNPYGLDITLEVVEGIAFADDERVLRDLAQTGKYEIILGHSTHSDAIAAIKDDHPDTLFAFSGSGNDPLGGNAYWIDVFIHEPAYLAGIIAGMMTETNQISAVAAFPFPNVNGPLHAFIDGARSVNPDVTAEVTYIESWFDPATAHEAAAAQIAAGSDMIYAERFGTFAAAEEAGNVRVFGHFTDQLEMSDVVVTSAVARWDAAFLDLIHAWYAYVTEGTPYDGPMERIVYTSMSDGGSSLGAVSNELPDDVRAAVDEAHAAILSGDLVVPLVIDPIE